MLDEKDTESDAPHYRYRISGVFFETRYDAEDWVAAGNIGGCYSIVLQIWCDIHNWQDAWYNRQTQEDECYECSAKQRAQQAAEQARRAADMAALEAWTKGLPL